VRAISFGGFLVLCLGWVGVGCEVGDSGDLDRNTLRAPIINGNLDTTHDAVVAVFLGMGACSGTIIHRDGGNAWVLTAAHCVTPNPPQAVAQGDDYDNPVATYPVADYAYHPAYSGPGGLFDFAVVRITGATAATPVIPALTPAEDTLAAGTLVRHLGYGITSYPSGYTTERHETTNTVNSVSASYFDYLQPTSGPCSGDSGGPALTVGGAERVAGVISGGDQTCSQYGVSGRVSAVYDSFIMAFINGTPITMTCDECFTGATSGSGACTAQVNACFANADCDALVSCIDPCVTQPCVQGCITAHPSGYTLYRAIYDCVCTTACTTACAGDALCTRGQGEPCSTGTDCDSGFCADGVCCSETCLGQCEACDRAGSIGLCGAVVGAPHGSRPACADDGSVCGGSCNGTVRTDCTYPDENSPCRALGCVDGVATPLAACDGAGSCPPATPVSCAPYLCNGDVCATYCVSGTDCVAGYLCEGGVCVGTGCVGDEDCPGDLVCLDGTCGEPECRTNDDCAAGALCDGGVCVEAECVTDSDCTGGLVCRDNDCVVAPSMSPGGCTCSAAGGPPPLPLIIFVLAGLLCRHRNVRQQQAHRSER